MKVTKKEYPGARSILIRLYFPFSQLRMASACITSMDRRVLAVLLHEEVGCGENSVPSTVVRGYDFCKPGGHLENVGLV